MEFGLENFANIVEFQASFFIAKQLLFDDFRSTNRYVILQIKRRMHNFECNNVTDILCLLLYKKSLCVTVKKIYVFMHFKLIFQFSQFNKHRNFVLIILCMLYRIKFCDK